uniref:DUF3615 domain-containing protein n=1 Tax=Leersia perrieri TaxID=77586 RepID=A0A0D9WJA7_9ORYZ
MDMTGSSVILPPNTPSDPQRQDGDCDPYSDYLVDSFITAVKAKPKQSVGSIDYAAAGRRQAEKYTRSALDYYNKDESNKYSLVQAFKSCAIRTNLGSYGHVNFVASSGSKEEFFFAEVCYDPETCGGRRNSEFVEWRDLQNPPIDNTCCYACGDAVKHPEDGSLFKAGHECNCFPSNPIAYFLQNPENRLRYTLSIQLQNPIEAKPLMLYNMKIQMVCLIFFTS